MRYRRRPSTVMAIQGKDILEYIDGEDDALVHIPRWFLRGVLDSEIKIEVLATKHGPNDQFVLRAEVYDGSVDILSSDYLAWEDGETIFYTEKDFQEKYEACEEHEKVEEQ